ncbi:hypothetical protein LEN26_009298 [Aphanomyces euteiches]|nr:hypothetical protein AeMF1_006209 [Aphanomyces euteiches]KAH9127108.1 hypothetical protein LEN26_009298 [Aphanomyces euteiches]KAH9184889.1 hypothetical protein AeNC1_013134 [Aphanomyces euteiches]
MVTSTSTATLDSSLTPKSRENNSPEVNMKHANCELYDEDYQVYSVSSVSSTESEDLKRSVEVVNVRSVRKLPMEAVSIAHLAKAHHAMMKNIIAKEKAHTARHKEKLDLVTAELRSLEDKSENLALQLQKLRAIRETEKSEYNAAVAALQAQVLAHEKSKAASEVSRSDLDAKIAALEYDAATAASSHTETVANLNEEKRDLTALLNTVKGTLTRTEAACVANEKRMGPLESERDELKLQMETLHANWKADKNDHATAIMKLQANLSTVEVSKVETETLVGDLEAKIAALKSHTAAAASVHAEVVAHLNEQKQELTNQLNAAQLALEVALTDVKDLRTQVTTLEAVVVRTEAASVATETRMRSLEAEREDLQSQVEIITAARASERSEYDAVVADLQIQVSILEESNVATEASISHLEDNLARADSTAATREADLLAETEALRREIEPYRAERLAREAAAAEEAFNQRFALPEQEVREMLRREPYSSRDRVVRIQILKCIDLVELDTPSAPWRCAPFVVVRLGYDFLFSTEQVLNINNPEWANEVHDLTFRRSQIYTRALDFIVYNGDFPIGSHKRMLLTLRALFAAQKMESILPDWMCH